MYIMLRDFQPSRSLFPEAVPLLDILKRDESFLGNLQQLRLGTQSMLKAKSMIVFNGGIITWLVG